MNQSDATSCGPIMIENLLYAARRIVEFPQNANAALLRAMHLECLNRKRADFYADFLPRQQENVFVNFTNSASSMLFQATQLSQQVNPDIMTFEDDLLITLVTVNRLFGFLLDNSQASLRSNKGREFFRKKYKSARTGDGKLHLIPRSNRSAAMVKINLESEQMINAITQEIRVALWDLQADRRSDVRLLGKFSMLLLGVGFGHSLGIFAIGAVASAQRAALVTALCGETASVASASASTVAVASGSATVNTLLNASKAMKLAQIFRVTRASAAATTVATGTNATFAKIIKSAAFATVTNPWIIVPAICNGISASDKECRIQ